MHDSHLVQRGVELGLDEQRARELTEFLHQLAGSGSVYDLSTRVCRSVRRLLQAGHASFVLSEGDQVYYAEESGPKRLWKGRRFPSTACISGWAIRHREATAVPDIYQDERVPQEAYRPTFVRSLAMAPMIHEDVATGALGAYWAESHEATEPEMFCLQTLATTAGDVLQRIRLLDDDRRRDSAQAPSAERGGLPARLLPVVAHDLRTPLSSIVNGLELLGSEDLSREGEGVLGRVRRSAERATRMVGQLMDYSEIEQHGALPLELSEVRLDRLTAGVLSEMRVGGPGADTRAELSPVEGLWDRDRLAEAIGNLVRNAVEHGDDGRPITVSVREHGTNAMVGVHNWGTPIPPERHAHLFHAFRRSEGVTGSIGLGLYITEQIALGHGGWVEVDSTQEKGTTFTLFLPKSPATFD